MVERIKQYFSDTRAELRKVTWPSRQDVREATQVVLVSTLLMTVFVGIVDQILSRIVKLVLG